MALWKYSYILVNIFLWNNFGFPEGQNSKVGNNYNDTKDRNFSFPLDGYPVSGKWKAEKEARGNDDGAHDDQSWKHEIPQGLAKVNKGDFVEVHCEKGKRANEGHNKDGFWHETSDLFIHEVLGDDGVANEGEDDHHGAKAEGGILPDKLIQAG